MTTETTYRVACGKHEINHPVLGDHMAATYHDECRTAGWYVTILREAPGCYCASLPGTFCDFCTGLRTIA